MNRLLLAVVAVAVIAVAGFAVFVIANGGPRPSPLVVTDVPPAAGATGAPEPVTEGDQPATEVGEAAAAAGDPAEANKRFVAWQKSMSAAGFTVDSGEVALLDNALALSDFKLSGSGWNWTASKARIDVASKDNFDITASGDQTLSFTFNGKPVEYGGTAQVRIGVHKGDGPGRILSVEFMKLTIAGENDTSPISLGSGGLRLVTTDDAVFAPIATDGELRLNDLVLPSQAGNPLGTKIDSLSATLFFQKALTNADPSKALQPWIGQTDALTVASLALTWGTLKAAGVGAVGLDDAGRPAGHFDVRIADVLGMLDAMNVLHPFDRNVLGNMYAKLLLNDGRQGNDQGMPFTINIANGSVALSERPHEIDDIPLGTVGQLHAPAAAQ